VAEPVDLRLPDGSRTLRLHVPEVPDVIAQELREGRWVVPPPIRLVLDLARAGGTVLDLGAHLGTCSLLAAASGARVVAVEASPVNAACLEASARDNELDVTIVPVAVGRERGTLRFLQHGPFGHVTEGDAGVEVRSLPVPDVLAETGTVEVDVVKIDVEGYEHEVLEGMGDLLRRPDAPSLVFEGNGHQLVARGSRTQDLVRRVTGFGYEVRLIEDGSLREIGPDDLPPGAVVDYLATKGAMPWPVLPRRSAAERAAALAAEVRHENRAHRAWAAGAARDAGDLLGDPVVSDALDDAIFDPADEVRAAVGWWLAEGASRGGDVSSLLLALGRRLQLSGQRDRSAQPLGAT
jgi:FkbM family methyltransferase